MFNLPHTIFTKLYFPHSPSGPHLVIVQVAEWAIRAVRHALDHLLEASGGGSGERPGERIGEGGRGERGGSRDGLDGEGSGGKGQVGHWWALPFPFPADVCVCSEGQSGQHLSICLCHCRAGEGPAPPTGAIARAAARLAGAATSGLVETSSPEQVWGVAGCGFGPQHTAPSPHLLRVLEPSPNLLNSCRDPIFTPPVYRAAVPFPDLCLPPHTHIHSTPLRPSRPTCNSS